MIAQRIQQEKEGIGRPHTEEVIPSEGVTDTLGQVADRPSARDEFVATSN